MTAELNQKNFIGGRWVTSRTGRTCAIRNPADLREVVHEYPLCDEEDVLTAIDSASQAFPRWRRVPIVEKAAIFRRAAALIRERRQDIARIITRENGKLIAESLAEIDSAVLELEYQLGEGERQTGTAGDGCRADLMAYTRKEPLGVVSAIIPWNFPFNVPFRKLVPALMAGNTALLKPASQTPGVGEAVMRIFHDAGLPDPVLQFVTGSGSELSRALVGHPNVRAVTFTGSTAVGRQIAKMAATNFTRTQLEMGGKNPMVVLADADLELAADAAVTAAYSCAGQWCTATSRLIVTEDVADGFLDRVLEKARALRVGAGEAKDTTMGPVCGKQQLHDVLAHVEKARAQNGQFILGGFQIVEGDLQYGCFIAPTVIDNVATNMAVATQEVFGPVLSVMRVRGYEEALELANDVPYGLSSSVFTRDLDRALHFVENSDAGLTHVNIHSAYKEPQLCFGGYKESGFGLPEAGSTGIEFFQDEKAIYIKKANDQMLTRA